MLARGEDLGHEPKRMVVVWIVSVENRTKGFRIISCFDWAQRCVMWMVTDVRTRRGRQRRAGLSIDDRLGAMA